MSEGIPVSGQVNTLEQEIAQIEQALASKIEALGRQQQSGQISEVPHQKEILREIIGERVGTSAPMTPAPGALTDSTGRAIQPPPVFEVPSYLSPELKSKVQELVNVAFTKTPSDAIGQARATNNAALIDAFHSALVDEFYNYLIERGKIHKI